MTAPATDRRAVRPPGWDALLLAILVLALLQIVGLAEAGVLPTRIADVLRHPLLGSLLPAAGQSAMGDVGPRPGDPIGLTLFALTLALLLAYLLVDLGLTSRWRTRVKWLLLAGIILTALVLPSAKLILLRQQSGPASYTHDGGVIQTEAAIVYFLEGKNPYREDYTGTPMAEWGFSRYRTALYHYPYLPWTFLFSAPFYLAGQALGAYDQRWVYLLLMLITLALAPRLVSGQRAKLGLVAVLALNPIMALDLIFGQNDSFVLSWLVFSLVSWQAWQARPERNRWALWLSAALFGLACATKPTAWFLAPFYAILLVHDRLLQQPPTWANLLRAVPLMLRRAWPCAGGHAGDHRPLRCRTWERSTTTSGAGAADRGRNRLPNLGLGRQQLRAGLRLGSRPLQPVALLARRDRVALPLLLWFVRRQQHAGAVNACWHYGVFLFAFFYASRFLNENYLGYILAFLAIGLFSSLPPGED